MKALKLNGQKVLLVRLDGHYYAYGGACPHEGGPLGDGVLCEGHVRCPWHQAVFDGRTGHVEQPPALDDLAPLEVRVDGDKILVALPEDTPGPRTPEMADYNPTADAEAATGRTDAAPARPTEEKLRQGRTFVIVGAGAAGLAAAQALRAEGYQGKITMLTREPHAPYDRTALSKSYLEDPDADRPVLRPGGFYRKHGIELLTGCEVTAVDVGARRVSCADGSELACDKLLLATGAVPRRLDVEGADLPGVFLLRSLADNEALRSAAETAKRAVVIGASFIGMEVAASLRGRGIEVTVVAPESVPFERTLGPDIGRMYREKHEAEGVTFRLGQTVDRFDGDGALQGVELAGGDRLDADLAVVGVGVRPATDYLQGLDLHDDGSVPVDANLRAAEDVYAAGDVARFPDWRTGEPVRIEHWRLALQHGQVAGRNLAGRAQPYDDVPFFWTNQYWVITQDGGRAGQWDEIVVDGDVGQQNFVAFYVKDGRVFAAAGCERDQAMGRIAEMLRAPEPPTLEAVRKMLP